MSAQIDYSELIPNNVNLASDRKLQRALERWHPKFMEWWNPERAMTNPSLWVTVRQTSAPDDLRSMRLADEPCQ